MKKALIPTIFNEDEDFFMKPFTSLSSLMENWGSPIRSMGSEVELYEDDEAFYVGAPLPGVKPEEVKVDLKGGILYIFAEKNEEKKNMKVHRKLSSKFSYQVALPFASYEEGKVEAELKEGLLRVKLPKSAAEKPVRIPVKSS